ncbi:MAG TPA: hypothetical protein VKB35_06485, partial [Ktedonobacteraceae bacterium]|nr:hypothetical protein [Ktedonobacteraceae bacterium]
DIPGHLTHEVAEGCKRNRGLGNLEVAQPSVSLTPLSHLMSEVTGDIGVPDARFRGPSQSTWNTIPNKRTGIFIGPSVSLRLTYQGPSLKHQGLITSPVLSIVIRH